MPDRGRFGTPGGTEGFGVVAVQEGEAGAGGVGGEEGGGLVEGDVEVVAEAARAGLVGARDVDHVFGGAELARRWGREDGLPVRHVERRYGLGGDFGG